MDIDKTLQIAIALFLFAVGIMCLARWQQSGATALPGIKTLLAMTIFFGIRWAALLYVVKKLGGT